MKINTIIDNLAQRIAALADEFNQDAVDAEDHAEKTANMIAATVCQRIGETICYELNGYELEATPKEEDPDPAGPIGRCYHKCPDSEHIGGHLYACLHADHWEKQPEREAGT